MSDVRRWKATDRRDEAEPSEPLETPLWSTLGVDAVPPQAAPPPRLDRYVLISELGRGGMGVVYRARDTLLGRDVALKLTRPGFGSRPEARTRHLREARACAQLDHPNVIDIFDIGEAQGQVWFAMRLLPGPTLAQRLARGGPLPPPEAARVAAQLARALHHAHSRGLVHRDVKPGNVLFDGDRPVLTDFGLVKLEDSDPLTRADQMLGTAAYMAPELLEQGPKAAGPMSDEYALAVLLYECLLGERPYAGRTPVEVLSSILDSPPLQPERRGAPPGLARICRRAMARNPKERFPDLEQMATALDQWADGAGPITISQDLARQLRERLRRQRRPLLVAAAAALLTLLALSGGALWLDARAEVRASESLDATWQRAGELLRAERGEEALALLQAFVQDERVAGTRARSRAWRLRAAILAELDRPEDGLLALGRAFALAEHPEEQRAALTDLAQRFADMDDLRRLQATLAVLEQEHAGAVEDEAISHLVGASLLGQRRFTEAAAHLSGPPARLAGALSHATLTELHGSQATPLVDPEGRRRLALLDADGETVRLLSADMALTSLSSATAWGRMVSLHGGDQPPELLLRGLPDCRRLSLVGDRLEDSPAGPCPALLGGVRADVDGDGVGEDYVGLDRRLARLDPGEAGRWTLSDPHPPTSAANGEVRDLEAIDLDGDGDDELLVGVGRWGTYDVRALDQRGGRLQLLARARLGDVEAITPVTLDEGPHLAALVYYGASPFDPSAFGEAGPHGEPGLHLLRWTGRAWERALRLPLPRSPDLSRPEGLPLSQPMGLELMAGDLDGDGQEEIIVGQAGSRTRVYQRGRGGWSEVTLDALFPLAALDLDGDGDDELLAADARDLGRVVILGAGADTPPSAASRSPRASAPPEALDRPAKRRWRRAEQLVSIGLPEAAIEHFRELARRGAGTLEEGHAWLRAAQLLEQQGALTEADRAFRAAANTPSLAPTAWEGAWRCARGELRLQEALDAAERRVALADPPPELLEDRLRLEHLLADEPLSIDLTEGPSSLLRVEDPMDVLWSAADQGLRVRAAGDSELLRVPLRRQGERVVVELSLSPLRLDWAAFLSVQLEATEPEATPVGLLYLSGYGGGGALHWAPSCGGSHRGRGFTNMDPARPPTGPIRLRFERLNETRRGVCGFERAQRNERAVFVHGDALPEGDVDLVVHMGSHAPGVVPVAEVLLHELRLVGFAPRSQPSTPLQRANEALLMGQPALALERLAGGGDLGSVAARFWAQAQLGDTAAAARSARALAAEGGSPEVLRRALVLSPRRSAQAIAAALGIEPYLALYHEAFRGVRQGLRARPAGAEELLRALGVIPELDREALELPPELGAAGLLDRAVAARHLGRPAEARADLQAAQAALEASPGAEGIGAQLTRLYLEQARASLDLQDHDAAVEALLDALAIAPDPQGTADRLQTRPEFKPLHHHPRWVEIEAARGL
ncbi:MAG: serine/threonine protein kinase [Alphaproteobacteria bacterium]|nr:serine/threonine protein kinase [Alphaproteobacteria bacterium]